MERSEPMKRRKPLVESEPLMLRKPLTKSEPLIGRKPLTKSEPLERENHQGRGAKETNKGGIK